MASLITLRTQPHH